MIDRGNKKIAEIRYFVVYVDDVKQKLFDVYQYSFSDLGIDPAAYSDDANGNNDQFMDAMNVPTNRAGINNLSLRQSWSDQSSDPDTKESAGEVWDLIGRTGPVVLVRNTPATPDVARSLTGFFQRIYKYDNSSAPRYLNRADTGRQSAVLDVILTGRARSASVNGETPNTLINGVSAVVQAVRALGYDYDQSN